MTLEGAWRASLGRSSVRSETNTEAGGSSWPRLIAVAWALFWAILAGAFFAGHDALKYLAAGERLMLAMRSIPWPPVIDRSRS